MRRYVRLYIAFIRNCVRQAAEFRANFWANLLTNLGWMASITLLLALIYHNTNSVAGWTAPEMFVLFGTYTIMRGISNVLFYKNLSQIPLYIRKGTMDWILTKPVNSQFYVSLRYLEFEDIGASVGGSFVIAYGLANLHLAHPPTAPTIFAFVVMLAASTTLFYSLTMLLMTLAFWLVRLDNLMVLSDTVFQIARTPIDIFGAFGPVPRFVLTYIIPLGIIATLPVKVLTGHFAPLAGAAVSIIVAGVFFCATIVFWNHATRSYSSASS